MTNYTYYGTWLEQQLATITGLQVLSGGDIVDQNQMPCIQVVAGDSQAEFKEHGLTGRNQRVYTFHALLWVTKYEDVQTDAEVEGMFRSTLDSIIDNLDAVKHTTNNNTRAEILISPNNRVDNRLIGDLKVRYSDILINFKTLNP